MYFSEKKYIWSIPCLYFQKKSVNEVYLANALHLYFKYLSKGQKGGFSGNHECIFLIVWIVNERIYFLWSMNKSNPVIREITNLFLEIHEEGL